MSSNTTNRPVMLAKAEKPVIMRYRGEYVRLLPKTQAAIETHWAELAAAGRSFTRGDVFAIASVNETPDAIEIVAELSDYAHYMYTVGSPVPVTHPCRVAHTAVLVESADGYLFAGRMAPHTVWPGRLQCAGGGLTRDDLRGEIIDFNHNAMTELYEEMGLHHDDPHVVAACRTAYVKTGGQYDFIAVIQVVTLKIDRAGVEAIFAAHNAALAAVGEQPEFSELVAVRADAVAVERLIATKGATMHEYLAPLLRNHVADTGR